MRLCHFLGIRIAVSIVLSILPLISSEASTLVLALIHSISLASSFEIVSTIATAMLIALMLMARIGGMYQAISVTVSIFILMNFALLSLSMVLPNAIGGLKHCGCNRKGKKYIADVNDLKGEEHHVVLPAS